MMTSPTAQLGEWRNALGMLRARVSETVLPLTPGERSKTPPGGGWSVDQVLEHLAVANTLYAAGMSAAIESQAGRAAPGSDPWKPTLIGRLLRYAVDPSAQRKLKSPRRAVPGPTPSPAVLERFVEGLDELAALAEQATSLDLRRVRFASPLASIIRLNLGDGFAICVAHTGRHANQIARTIAANRSAA